MSNVRISRRATPALSVAALVGLATLVAGWLVLFVGGEASSLDAQPQDVDAAIDDAEDQQEASVTPVQDDGEELATVPEVSFELYLSRDPFESIRPEEPADGAGDPSDPGDPDDPTNGGTDPSDPSGPGTEVPQPEDPDAACRTNGEAVCDGRVITLLETRITTALIQVDTESYDVTEGDVFAEDFLLLSVDGDCVNLLYVDGDETERFRLCIGDSTAK